MKRIITIGAIVISLAACEVNDVAYLTPENDSSETPATTTTVDDCHLGPNGPECEPHDPPTSEPRDPNGPSSTFPDPPPPTTEPGQCPPNEDCVAVGEPPVPGS